MIDLMRHPIDESIDDRIAVAAGGWDDPIIQIGRRRSEGRLGKEPRYLQTMIVRILVPERCDEVIVDIPCDAEPVDDLGFVWQVDLTMIGKDVMFDT